LKLVRANPDLKVHWVVLSAEGDRAEEARTSTERFLDQAPNHEVEVSSFRERYFPYLSQLKEFFDDLGTRVHPDLVLTHHGGDAHQDHRVVAELTWNTFRDHLILEYEIPKYDGDLGNPNLFVPLPAETCQRKVELLLEQFPSQRDHRWFTADTFWAMLRLRGVESNSPSGFAEGFHCRKATLDLPGAAPQ
jgi:LmbE family N-acetylglucosaminyl deacetylase